MRGTAKPGAKQAQDTDAQGPTATLPPSGWGGGNEAPADTETASGPPGRQGSLGRQMSRMVMKKAGICFPCEPFGYCPAAIKGFIPGTWQKIQDTTHCMLVLGLVSSLTMLILDVIDLVSFGECFEIGNFFCAKEIVIVAFGLPFFWYCATTITQYDQDLQEKQKAVKQQMNQLLGGLKDLVGEMETLLAGATESATGLAEKNFKDKHRDFNRFLANAKSKYDKEFYQDPKLVEQFKKFCMNWLNIFKECSIDPVNAPKTLLDEEELARCVSIGETADLVMERLAVTEVRFLTAKRDADASKLTKRRGSIQDKKVGQRLMMLTNGKGDGKDENLIEKDDFMEDEDSSVPDKITWVSCGASGCGCNSTDGDFPRECRCICMKFSMLSKSHRNLLLVFVLGFALLAAEAGLMSRHAVNPATDYPDKGNPFTFMLIAATQLSLITVLCRFEAIDVVEQLKREVQHLQEENETVQEERKEMSEFWSQANELSEFWLYRTVPRLGITKEVTHVLLDAIDRGEDITESLKGINVAIENIEEGLGKIADWKGDDKISLKEKKAFAARADKVQDNHLGLEVMLEELQGVKAPRLTNG